MLKINANDRFAAEFHAVTTHGGVVVDKENYETPRWFVPR